MSLAGTDVAPTATSVVPGAALVGVTFGLARYGYGLLLPDMSASLHLGAGTAGLISSAAYGAYLAANLVVVAITDRYGPRVAVGGAGVAAAVGMTLVAVAPNVPVLAIGVLVAGSAAGLAFPPYAEIVERRVKPERRDVAWSTVSSGTGWGVAVAGPIAIAAGDRWRLAWFVFVALAVAVGSAATLAAPRARAVAHTRPRLSWTWFFCPKSRPLLVSAVLVGAGSSVWWSFSVDALRADGLSSSTARLAYAACGVAGIAASVTGSVFGRTGLRRGYLVSAVLLAAGIAALPLAGGHAGVAVGAAAAFGVLYPSVIAAQGIWSSRVFGDHPAAGLAATNTALTVGTLAGPVGAGQLVSALGYATTLTTAGVVVLLALPFCPPTSRRRVVLAAHRCRATPVREKAVDEDVVQRTSWIHPPAS